MRRGPARSGPEGAEAAEAAASQRHAETPTAERDVPWWLNDPAMQERLRRRG